MGFIRLKFEFKMKEEEEVEGEGRTVFVQQMSKAGPKKILILGQSSRGCMWGSAYAWGPLGSRKKIVGRER